MISNALMMMMIMMMIDS